MEASPQLYLISIPGINTRPCLCNPYYSKYINPSKKKSVITFISIWVSILRYNDISKIFMRYTPKLDYILGLSGSKVFNPDIEGGDAANKMFA